MSQQYPSFSPDADLDDDRPLDTAQNHKMWAAFAFLAMCLVAGYWNMFVYTASFWQMGLYSHGWIVPLFAIFLLYSRSGMEMKFSDKELIASAAALVLCVGIFFVPFLSELVAPSSLALVAVLILIGLTFYHFRNAQLLEVASSVRWAGLGILLASMLVRLAAAIYDASPYDRLSFIGAVLGICMLVGGTAMLRWAGPPLGFLVFMFPLPSVLEHNILWKLQTGAAIASSWTLQLLDAPAVRDGNKIIIDNIPLDVADACSGLRMATIFGAMSLALAILMVERPWWDRLIVLLSAIPVALATNVIRITITALIYMFFPESEGIHKFVHDWAGFAMMPIAMGILWLELELLRRISIPIDADDFAALGTING
jgi:exosortase